MSETYNDNSFKGYEHLFINKCFHDPCILSNFKLSRLEYANVNVQNFKCWEGTFAIESNQDNLNQAIVKNTLLICIRTQLLSKDVLSK